VRGQNKRFALSLSEYRGSWAVVAFAARHADVLEPIRFPLLTEVTEHRRVTMIVDPGGVIRHVGLRRSARETLAALEELLVAPQLRVAA